MQKRSPFPPVFWVANSIEILERFAYYGIYLGFGIYMEYLGYSKAQLGIVQTIFLLFSYVVPVFSGTFADRFGFKKVLIVSYLAYLPSILLLIITKSFSGIALTMLSIGLAAGIFKPLVSGTVRVTTDGTNKTLGFGIFYAMVNVGASFGPIVMGRLRAISWNYAFIAAAISIGVMLLVTIIFYKEPEREIEKTTLSQKFKDMGVALADKKFLTFLILIGVFFWIPLWAFFNLLAMYVDKNLDTVKLYLDVKHILGATVANFISQPEGSEGTRKLLGESISHTGYIIMILQIFVSRIAEKFKAIPIFSTGLFISALGFLVLGYAHVSSSSWVFLGIMLFAIGEMTSSPRIQEYITWMAPPEKAGLYMGTNFLAIGIGSFSGVLYTPLYGYFCEMGHPEYVWYTLAGHVLIGILVIYLFIKKAGEFRELTD
ncbi:MAG: MFS transporter [Calditrichaeota bacterium]|nr:MFS transporter [Calditrichota bacterium]